MADSLSKQDATWIKGKYLRVHPAWYAFIKFCQELRYGEIERLKIQDGLPMTAEEVKKKIKFIAQQVEGKNNQD